MDQYLRTAVWTLLIAIGLIQWAGAKPMLPPTPQEAAGSPVIVVCEYVGHEKEGSKTYSGGAIVEYRVTKTLKGQASAEKIRVNYAFHDGTPCIEPGEWKFDEKTMPKPGTQWILFLTPNPHDKTGQPYTTYRGDYGRWPATEAKLEQVQKLLSPPK